MRERVVLISLLLVALATTVAILLGRSAEPAWHGKSLTMWMEQLAPPIFPRPRVIQTAPGTYRLFPIPPPPEFWAAEEVKRRQAAEAIRAIGTNAIPWLLDEVYSRDTKMRSTLIRWSRKHRLTRFSLRTAAEKQRRALAALDELGPAALWAWVEVSTNDLSTTEARARSMGRLYGLISQAAAAVPPIMTLVEHPNPMTRKSARDLVQRFDVTGFLLNRHDLRRSPDASGRAGAAWSLGFKGEHADWTIALLTSAAKDPEAKVREAVIEAIGKFTTNAASAVPVIHRALADPSPRVRRAATNTLARITPRQLPMDEAEW